MNWDYDNVLISFQAPKDSAEEVPECGNLRAQHVTFTSLKAAVQKAHEQYISDI